MAKEKKSKPIRISAKNLGSLNMPDFDPQAFWLQAKMRFQMPFSIFPGIFSTLDKYQKDITSFKHVYEGQWPSWVCGDIEEAIDCPHWSKFGYTDEKTDIVVSGAMDDCYLLKDGTLLILDNKLAKYTEGQDRLLPMYTAQLNAYAEICKRTNIGTASKLQLVYHEPVTDLDKDAFEKVFLGDQYILKFDPKVVDIEIDEDLIPRLLEKAHAIISSPVPPSPPDGKIGKDMDKVLKMIKFWEEGQSAERPAEVEKELTVQKLKVSLDGKEVGAVNVRRDILADSSKEEVLDMILDDALIQMACPGIDDKRELVTFAAE